MVTDHISAKLQIKTNPGMISFQRNDNSTFSFIAGAHGGSYKGICSSKRIVEAIYDSLHRDQIIQTVSHLGWDDIVYEYKRLESQK